MIKKYSLACVLVLIALAALHAQDKKKKAYRPDIPGYFMLDLGFNNGQSRPANFNQGFWGSRTLDVYYHYPIQLGKSKFSYNPGGGFAFERFKFTNNYTLSEIIGSDQSYDLVQVTQLPFFASGSVSVQKSMLVANYFDLMPVEFRFDTNPKNPSSGFNVAVGGRVGFLLESHTKIKYTQNGVSGVYKDKQTHGLNQLRYGFYTRLGIGNFNVFWQYNLSPYFSGNSGPSQTGMNTMTIGISLNGL
ncbi:MAG: hypothetical protein OJF59_002419 [Cytophagales bacterium]|nr:hypothetical protein [Bacteroidota bacterium]WHZ08665.1 MAG: hypothetical protein OJF59_002419 [Cytophagales bacterium]